MSGNSVSGTSARGIFRGSSLLGGLTALAILAGCAQPEVILPGKREEIRGDVAQTYTFENQVAAIRLPAQVTNTSWTHRVGTPGYRTSHAALAATPSQVWAVGIGADASRKNRITADPVVADGRIYTMDAESQVVATSTGGAQIWARDLTPARDKAGDVSGGGMAYANGTLYVSTGFGRLYAMDPATGAVAWEQKLGAIGSGTPTYFDGRVYVVSGDDTGWAVDAETGRIDWQVRSLPDVANIQSPAAPAVTGRFAIFAFGSGEVQAVFRRGGLRRWDAGISGERVGRAINTIGDISSDPVVDGSTIYAGNHSGRLVALDFESGSRKWTAQEGALSPVWPVGGSVFLVSEENQLVRLNASDGSKVWGVELPLFVKDRPRRQKQRFSHYGPILAGGQLVVASSDGLIRFFDPASGEQTSSLAIKGGAASNPVVAGGVLYVVSNDGKLHAFR